MLLRRLRLRLLHVIKIINVSRAISIVFVARHDSWHDVHGFRQPQTSNKRERKRRCRRIASPPRQREPSPALEKVYVLHGRHLLADTTMPRPKRRHHKTAIGKEKSHILKHFFLENRTPSMSASLVMLSTVIEAPGLFSPNTPNS